MSFFNVSTFGPILPTSVLNGQILKLKSFIQQAFADITTCAPLGFTTQHKLDNLRDLHLMVDQLNLLVNESKRRESLWLSKEAFDLAAMTSQQDKLAKIFSLPHISEYADFNKYSNLEIEEITSTEVDECECGAYSHIDFVHECMVDDGPSIIKFKSNKSKVAKMPYFNKKFLRKGIMIPFVNLIKTKKILPLAVRNVQYLNKIKKIISLFETSRLKIDAKIKSFINYSQLTYDDIVSLQPNYRYVYCLYNLIADEVNKVLYDDVDEDAVEAVEDLDCLISHKEEGIGDVFDPEAVLFSKLQRVVEARAEANDEEPHGDCSDLNVSQESNVVLTTHAEESSAIPIEIPQDRWESLCSSQQITEYTQLMSRWQRFDTVSWSTGQSNGTLLTSYNLPIDFVKAKLASPNCVLFSQYAYYKSDLEVKIVINSNKFHVGSLQASFYYGAALDKYYADRSNIWSASQMTHCVIDAAAASDGILKIPYRHYKPLMGTSKRKDDQNILDMGLLRIFVLNSLITPASDPSQVFVSVFLRFVNPSFHGMKPRDIGAVGEMMGMSKIVETAATLLNQQFPDPQRDNPSDVIPAKPMVPWSAHSWCVGDILTEPLNVLRMQATGTTPHPPGTLPKEPEMEIKYLTSIFGLIKQITWTTAQSSGVIIAKLPFSPSLDSYPRVNLSNPDEYTCDIMPPVSVMSQLFAYWRGSLQYKFDFIASQFHTGRLIIAYLPRIVGDATVTLDQLTFCDHIVVDLRDERQVLFSNQFISDKPWWPRRSNNRESTEIYPPGYIYVCVLNPLTATSAVSNRIDINIYLRGGDDFELQIPVNPTIGLSFNTTVPKNVTNLVTYYDGYGPPATTIYIGTWHYFGGKAVLRYGPVTDHVVKIKSDYIPKSSRSQYRVNNAAIENKFVDGANKAMIYFVPIWFDGYYYFAMFSTQQRADVCVAALKEGNIPPENFDYAKYLEDCTDGEYLKLPNEVIYWKLASTVDDFVVVSEAGDERKEVCGDNLSVQPKLRSTNQGQFTFGEKIYSIKQLLRRYAPYCQIISSVNNPSNPQLADFVIPILPQGLDLLLKDTNNKWLPYGCKVRDGPHAILASGYRFFRGSMRIRLVIDSATDGAIWLNHRPEYRLGSLSAYPPDKTVREACFMPGYASLIQFTSVNNVVEVEVPFYLPGQFGMLQRPDLKVVEDAVHYSLGSLFVGFDVIKGVPRDTPFMCAVFSSMGDDMSFSVFQGFPPMINLAVFDSPVQAEGPVDWVKQKIVTSVENEVKTQVVNTLTAANLEVPSSIPQSSLLDLLKQHISDLDAGKQQLILSIFTNLVHSFINPSITQIAWSVASIFVHMGVIAVGFLEKVVNAFRKLIEAFGRLASRARKPEQAPEAVQPEGPEDEDLKTESAFVSTCVASMLALANASVKPLPKDLPNFAAYLYQGLPRFSLTANGLYTFLKNNILMFKKIWYWLISKFKPDYVFYAELEGCDNEVREFVSKVQWSLNGNNYHRVRKEPQATAQVYELANLAQSYLAKKSLCTIGKPMPLFEMYCKKIIMLRDELSREKLSPPIRFEPFVISVVGKSNVGKSHLAQKLATELLASIGYAGFEELVYTRTPGNAYWNGLANQPICLFDDFLNITDPQFALTQVGELFCLKSKAVFNPPMAAVEEKKLRYNPLIVLLCSNEAYPDVSGIALKEAWMRRRDFMVKAIKKDIYKGVHPRHLPKTVKQEYGHLTFQEYKYPSGVDENGAECCEEGPSVLNPKVMSYKELLPVMIKAFHDHYYEECEQYHKAIHQVRRFYPEADESSNEYNERILKAIEKINMCRVPDDDRKEIEQYQQIIRNRMMECDMTNFVTKTNATRKLNAMRCEVGVKPAVVEPNAGEEKPKLSMRVDLINKYLQPFGAEWNDINQARFGSEMGKFHDHHKYIPAMCCRCYILAPFVTDYSCMSDPKFQTYTTVFPIMAARMDKVNDLFEFSAHGCDADECFLKDPHMHCLWLKDQLGTRCRGWTANILPSVIADKLPEYFKKEVAAGNIQFMSMEEADAVLNSEISNRSMFEKIWDSIPSWGSIIKWLWRLAAIFGSLGILFNAFKYMFKGGKDARAVLGEESGESDDIEEFTDPSLSEVFGQKKECVVGESYTKGTVASRITARVPIKQMARAEASEQQDLVIQSQIVRNTFWIEAEYGLPEERKSRLFRCFGLCNRYFILIDHYYYFIRSCVDVNLYYVKDSIRIPLSNNMLSSKYCTAIVNSALYVCRMPEKTIPQFRNIVKFIIPSRLTNNISGRAKLIEFDITKDSKYMLKCHDFHHIGRRKDLCVNNDDGSTSYVSSIYTYEKCGRGLCGSVLVSGTNTHTPILGIHIAGLKTGESGYSEALVYETFEHLQGDVMLDEVECEATLDESPVAYLDGNIIQHGCVPKKKAAYPSPVSRLIHTECAGEITPITYDFPVLTSKDNRLEVAFSPLLEGCKYHTQPIKGFPSEYLDRAYDDYRNVILAYTIPQRINVGRLSVEDAVVGLEGNPLYEPIPMDTSEGYPWILERPKGASNKSWMFERKETSTGWKLLSINEKLKATLASTEEKRRKGLIQMPIFADCLKDNKLPLESVLQPGKTRIFSISPVDFTIQQRQYSMDFVVAYTRARFNVESAIGIDIKGLEANMLCQQMLEYGNNISCGDYKKFGDRLYADVVLLVYNLIWEWYNFNGVEDLAFRKVLMCFGEEISHSTHIMINQVYSCMCGMPSGNPITVVINNMANCIYIRVIWQHIMVKTSLQLIDMASFRNNVRMVAYGDDLMLSIKDEVIEFFNTVSISEAFAEYDIVFTDASKTGSTSASYSLLDPRTTFLKHTFHRHPFRANIYMAQLDRRSAYEICNWTWNTQNDVRASSLESCRAMMEEVFGCDREEYEQLRRKTQLYWQKKGVYIAIPDWDAVEMRIYNT
ncbi:polyprotein [Aulacophora lewisii iflavirus 1]|nr:polyprotein [Aulacophora lewisii iflavirus 1]